MWVIITHMIKSLKISGLLFGASDTAFRPEKLNNEEIMNRYESSRESPRPPDAPDESSAAGDAALRVEKGVILIRRHVLAQDLCFLC